MIKIAGLKVFSEMKGLPQNEQDQILTFQSDIIRKVICFSLGPLGTNIGQASGNWLERMCIGRKAEIRFFDTPEICLQEARKITGDGVVAIFWTCAVYSQESQFFFGNPDVWPFFTQEIMLLDEMQLATIPENYLAVKDGIIPEGWKISSHPSPQHLVKSLNREIILVNSNSAAAKHCRDGYSSACITTEAARGIYGLATIHSFGSPPMVFFGGITEHGANVIEKAFFEVNDNKGKIQNMKELFSGSFNG
jgi:hypothetical protein